MQTKGDKGKTNKTITTENTNFVFIFVGTKRQQIDKNGQSYKPKSYPRQMGRKQGYKLSEFVRYLSEFVCIAYNSI